MNIHWKKFFWSYLSITTGSLLAATGLVMFLVPNKIASGGVSGLATVIYHLSGFPVGSIILIINIPFFLLGLKVLGKSFGLKTLWGIVVLSVATDILAPFFSAVTHDPLLASLYGGAVAGLGMGLVFRAGGTTGGTDLVAALINHYFPGFSMGQGLFLADAIVVTIAGIVFDPELALYAAISIFVLSKVIDLVQEGFNFSKAAVIISDHSEEILDNILKKVDRGVTGFKGYGGYSGYKKDILLVTVSRSEVARLKKLIYQVDDAAFVIMVEAHEVLGEGFKEW